MRDDDELMKILRERWAQQGDRAAPKASAPGDWSKLVQLNVRVPVHVKKSIEASAAARGVTLAQFIAMACAKDDEEARG